jgi:hypothetical protein
VFPGAFTPPDVVILVSPSFYLQRRDFYQGTTAKVYPLLFEWQTFSANQLRKLMRLSDSDTQLYVSTMLYLLRDYQRENKIPTFDSFSSASRGEVRHQRSIGPAKAGEQI